MPSQHLEIQTTLIVSSRQVKSLTRYQNERSINQSKQLLMYITGAQSHHSGVGSFDSHVGSICGENGIIQHLDRTVCKEAIVHQGFL
ncbi:hypothetical protein FGO68_gene6741 [Halteria grandinella]|uniref:Uncharacterized protein n=1 Tax=Halteria grandinella TaxID=5974 RepID=A0A8J8T4B9_HALGN|nr:hypothetical protein FGO68_gene6741 [Halteria grandinella]